MFYYISGKLAHLDPAFAVIDAGGIGYKLTISGSTHSAMPHHLTTSTPPDVKLYTYMAVREDGIELFGFISEDELASFKLLITVSGVGPKAAISILSGIYQPTAKNEWIGPRLFNVWGFPKKQILKTCKADERERIAQNTEEIYKKMTEL